MDQDEIYHLLIAGKAWSEASKHGSNVKNLYNDQTHRPQTPLDLEYLFTTTDGQTEWDVFETRDEITVKAFGEYLTHGSMRLDTGSSTSLRPIPTILRYIVFHRIDPNDEGLRLLGEVVPDHYVIAAFLLIDDARYIPIGAAWTGRAPTQEDKQWTNNGLNQIASDLTEDLDRSRIKPSPVIDPVTLEAMVYFEQNKLTKAEQHQLVDLMKRLPDTTFMEVISRLLPTTWSRNEWFATQPYIAERAYTIKQKMSSSKMKIRQTPWKTAWMKPIPFEPKIIYKTGWNQETDHIQVP